MKFLKSFFCFLIFALIFEANARMAPKDETIFEDKSRAFSKEEASKIEFSKIEQPSKIWEKIGQQLASHLQERVGGTRVKIYFDRLTLMPSLSTKASQFDLIDLRFNADAKRFTAKVIFKGGPQTPFVLRGHFSFLREVAIVKNTIPKGGIIESEDISWVLREETPYLHRAILKNQRLLPGSLSRRVLECGKVIKAQDLQKPLLVRKGRAVSVTYKKGGLSIKLTEAVKALEEGAQGDLIQILNTKTNVKLTAVVVGQNAVQIRQQEDKK